MWEKYDKKPEEIIVRMDPGMAFGTGTHETTRLVCGLIEKYLKKGDYMLDVGTAAASSPSAPQSSALRNAKRTTSTPSPSESPKKTSKTTT